jgi:hypothetical protein
MNKKKLGLIVLVMVVIASFFALDLGRYLSLEYLKGSQAAFESLYDAKPLANVGVYYGRNACVFDIALCFAGQHRGSVWPSPGCDQSRD